MNSAAPAIDASGLLEMMLSLMLVIALIIGLSWLVGRMRTVQRNNSGAMGVLGELVIGPKERIVLVRIGDAQALVGVSAAGVTSLQLLDRALEISSLPQTELPNAASFAQKLKEMMHRPREGG